MLLKNSMEEKQLDFNQPLLSVRRFSSTAATSKAESKRKANNSLPKLPSLPAYKSELKSGPIRNPGTVPFLWEWTPGRPKDETKSQTKAVERPPIVPKLPPGRLSNPKHKSLEKAPEEKDSKRPQKGNVITSSQTVSSTERIEETESFKLEEDYDGDDNEVYLDAVDALSRTESFFYNCSVSGVSGLDDTEWKPTPNDYQTRDFMMGRFLPAAKAMASETPHSTTRRKAIKQEQPRYANRIISTDKKQPRKQYSPNRLLFHIPDGRSEETDNEDYYEEAGNSSAAVCGLLPRFCLKSSFCLLNPVPGMRVQAHEAISSSRRPQARFSSASSSNETENGSDRGDGKEHRSTVGSQIVAVQEDKLDLQSESNQNENIIGRRNFGDLLAKENADRESGSMSPVEKTLYIDSVHKVKSPRYFNASNQGDDLDVLRKSSEMVETISADSSDQEIKNINAVEKSKSLESVDPSFLCSPNKSSHGMQIDVKSSSREDDQDLKDSFIKTTTPKESAQGRKEDSVSSNKTKMADDVKFDSKESSRGNFSRLALTLPLPKSPSESWLKRTLPNVVSTRNTSSWSSPGMRNCTRSPAHKSLPSDSKWETIVKTSNVQQGHLRFAQEMLTSIPEN